MLRSARNSIPVSPMSVVGLGFISMSFRKSCPFVRKELPLMRYPTSARPWTSPTLPRVDGAAHLIRGTFIESPLRPRCLIYVKERTNAIFWSAWRKAAIHWEILAERVSGILKTEWLDKRPLRNWSEAQAYIVQIIGLENSRRLYQRFRFFDAGSGASQWNRDPTQVRLMGQ